MLQMLIIVETNFIIGVVLLLLVLVPGALKGPLTISLPPESPLIKLIWRTQGGLIISILISVFMYVRNGATMSFWNDTTIEILIDNALRSFLGFIWATGLILGCSLTVTSHAQITNNATGVFIIMFSALTWVKLSKYDLIGHGVWIIGVAVIIFDPHAIKFDSNKPSIIGALIPLIGAGFGSILTFMSHSKKRLHPIITMTQFYFFSVIYQLIIFPLFTDSHKFYTLDPINGAFGWLCSFKNVVVVLWIVSPLTGVLEKLFYLAANNYFSLQTISILIVFEPFIGQFFGVLLGQDHIPGAMTFIGLIVTTIGFGIASYGERDSSTMKN